MSFIVHLTDALLYRDFFKSKDRDSDVSNSYDIIGSGTVDVKEQALQKRFESIDERMLAAVIEKSEKIRKDLDVNRQRAEDGHS